MIRDARAFWLRSPGVGEIRPVTLPAPGPDEVLVRTLVLRGQPGHRDAGLPGRVPASQYAAMRAPFQEGDFPGPVKYGYLNVGVVEARPAGAARSDGVLPVPAPDARTWCRPTR